MCSYDAIKTFKTICGHVPKYYTEKSSTSVSVSTLRVLE